MGCSPSAGHLSSTVATKNGEHNLSDVITPNEKYYIQKTWKIVSNNMPGIGAKIFLTIFTIRPDIKEIFSFRDSSGETLLRDPNFRGHASRFMQAVGAAVDNINALDKAMAPLLFGLGEQHIHYKGFNEEYFDVFVMAILRVFEKELGGNFTTSASDAWTHVLEFMITKLKEGYQHAMKNYP